MALVCWTDLKGWAPGPLMYVHPSASKVSEILKILKVCRIFKKHRDFKDHWDRKDPQDLEALEDLPFLDDFLENLGCLSDSIQHSLSTCEAS